MLVPLILLAVLSLAGGWIGIPQALGGSDRFSHFLDPAVAAGQYSIPEDLGIHRRSMNEQGAASRGGRLRRAVSSRPAEFSMRNGSSACAR